MKLRFIFRALALGTALSAGFVAPLHAQALRVLSNAVTETLALAMNRAVVVESDVPFAELSIANPGIADITTLSDRTIYVLGKTPGRTTMTILGADGSLISNVEVQVTPDIAEFKERLQQILSGERIEVRTANDGIVLSGTVSSIAKLDRALELAQRYAPDRVSNLMSVGGTQQVMLKVRFAEMQRSVSKNLGASFGLLGPGSPASLRIGTGNVSGINSLLAGSPPTLSADSFGGIGAAVTMGDITMGAMLEALEAKGMVRTLAEPNLTALSGQEAKFLAGGEYPIPVSTADGISIEYKPFGVELAFVPRVIDGDIINLEIRAAVSAIDTTQTTVNAGGFAISAFKRRDAQTTVEMRDGESFAIAGLLQDDFNDLANQIPWLGDVPVLGLLFRSASFERNQSELVIIVTPHLVSPIRGEALALPTDRVHPPTENQLFLFGQTSSQQPLTGAVAEVARQNFSGSFGYVME